MCISEITYPNVLFTKVNFTIGHCCNHWCLGLVICSQENSTTQCSYMSVNQPVRRSLSRRMISIYSSRNQMQKTLLQKAYAPASNVITKHHSSALCIHRAASVNAVRLVCIPFFLSLRGSDKLRESLLFNKVTE